LQFSLSGGHFHPTGFFRRRGTAKRLPKRKREKSEFLPDLAAFVRSKGDAIPGTEFIYLLGEADGGLVKIGTTHDLWDRVKKIRAMNPKPLELLMFWMCHNGKSVEAALHATFRNYRRHGEWFEFGNYSSTWGAWKYRHLAVTALLTCASPPIPAHGSVAWNIQFGHVASNDSAWDTDNGLDDRECFPSDVFAEFYPRENDKYELRGWSDETREQYGFPRLTPAACTGY
jgi:hypothetical protein